MRAQAETENVRKRYEREKEETAKYAITKFARDIVNVGDNFQRAIDAVPAGAAEREPALKSFFEGVTLTERELLNILERHGIKRLQPERRTLQPALASGDDGGPAQRRCTRYHRAGLPAGLYHRGAGAAPGDGGGRQGRAQARRGAPGRRQR